MPPELCFFKDFDSFTLEPDYLEVVYGTKPFRFGYATNDEDRKFSVKALGKMQITLPKMLLQCPNEGVWHAVHVVNFYAEFQDVLLFCDFVQKLARVAVYQQGVPKSDSSTNITSDSDDDDQIENEVDEANIEGNMLNEHQILDCSSDDKKMTSARVTIRIVEGQALGHRSNMAYFEIDQPETGDTYRFLNPPMGSRVYDLNPPKYQKIKNRGGRDFSKYLVTNVMMQVPIPNMPVVPGVVRPPLLRGVPPAGTQYVNLTEVDLEIDLRATHHIFATNLDHMGYRLI